MLLWKSRKHRARWAHRLPLQASLLQTRSSTTLRGKSFQRLGAIEPRTLRWFRHSSRSAGTRHYRTGNDGFRHIVVEDIIMTLNREYFARVLAGMTEADGKLLSDFAKTLPSGNATATALTPPSPSKGSGTTS